MGESVYIDTVEGETLDGDRLVKTDRCASCGDVAGEELETSYTGRSMATLHPSKAADDEESNFISVCRECLVEGVDAELVDSETYPGVGDE